MVVWLLFQFFFLNKKETLITEIERIYFSALKFENIKILIRQLVHSIWIKISYQCFQ